MGAGRGKCRPGAVGSPVAAPPAHARTGPAPGGCQQLLGAQSGDRIKPPQDGGLPCRLSQQHCV